jgi:hypothetical protein
MGRRGPSNLHEIHSIRLHGRLLRAKNGREWSDSEKQVRKEALTQFEEENLIEDSYLDGWPTSHSSSLKKIKKSKKADLYGFGESSQSTPTKSPIYLLQPRSKFADSCDPVVVTGSEETIIEPLLTHTSLYILAEKWGISSLKRLTLFKLDQSLSMFKLNAAKVPHIVELVRQGYAGTPDLETGIDDLRELVCQYIAANVKVMSEDETFQALIEEGGAFVRDLWKRMLPRVG